MFKNKDQGSGSYRKFNRNIKGNIKEVKEIWQKCSKTQNLEKKQNGNLTKKFYGKLRTRLKIEKDTYKQLVLDEHRSELFTVSNEDNYIDCYQAFTTLCLEAQ